MQDNASECSETSSVTSSSSLVTKAGPAVSSGHDRTLPNVLTRIRNIIDNRGSVSKDKNHCLFSGLLLSFVKFRNIALAC